MTYDVVIPTTGRASLGPLLAALARSRGPLPERVILADDRPAGAPRLKVSAPHALRARLVLVRTPGLGPAAARNAGWRAGTAEWAVFLDDDVVVTPAWRHDLEQDLEQDLERRVKQEDLPGAVAGSQGRVRVPLPAGRRPTDWERSVQGLETARWATADMAYRRPVLEALGGFDERFPRAYREDAEFALRVLDAGERLVAGRREVVHPVAEEPAWISVRRQAGNADDVLMERLHGRAWRERAGARAGRRRRHLATVVAGVGALAAAAGGRRRAAFVLGAGWFALTGAFAWERIAPGPRNRDEAFRMLLTSAAIPAAATYHRLRGAARAGRLLRPPAAVLLDRDGTLVENVPHNGDPRLVRLRPGAREAVERLRRAGTPVAVVSNQSGVGRGLLALDQVDAVNRRVEELLGPLDGWFVCPHRPDAGCDCRKPRPGLILEAAGRLGVAASRCAVVGDIGADVEAARAAGARSILVPTGATRPEEVRGAPEVAADLEAAVARLLGPAARTGASRVVAA